MSSSPPLPAKNLGKGSLPVGKSNGAVLSRARSRPSEEANLEQSDPHNVNQSVKVCPRRKFSNSVVSCRNAKSGVIIIESQKCDATNSNQPTTTINSQRVIQELLVLVPVTRNISQ
ncbi:uncharacterized protein LOC134208007 [Armigeres subalbatus]|uniref:uncharacterized protein LOC134208007 n=1 Tax=Armigeres subalbatus TaxID=124917 RepID=UPI002ED5D455